MADRCHRLCIESHDAEPFDDCWFLTGATASGKTGVGAGAGAAARRGDRVARLDGDLSRHGHRHGQADGGRASRRAASPDRHRRAGGEYSVAQYVDATRRRPFATIRARGREVLFVGGTPLYLKSLLRGLFDGPPANWELREEIEAELEQVGQAALHERLMQVDPVAASAHSSARHAADDPGARSVSGDGRADQPSADAVRRRPAGGGVPRVRAAAGARRAAPADRRPRRGDDRRGAGGRSARADGRAASSSAGRRARRSAIASRWRILAGEIERDEMLERIKARTRQFAKRQGTWFRSLSECRFVDIAGEVDADAVAERIIAEARRRLAKNTSCIDVPAEDAN